MKCSLKGTECAVRDIAVNLGGGSRGGQDDEEEEKRRYLFGPMDHGSEAILVGCSSSSKADLLRFVLNMIIAVIVVELCILLLVIYWRLIGAFSQTLPPDTTDH